MASVALNALKTPAAIFGRILRPAGMIFYDGNKSNRWDSTSAKTVSLTEGQKSILDIDDEADSDEFSYVSRKITALATDYAVREIDEKYSTENAFDGNNHLAQTSFSKSGLDNSLQQKRRLPWPPTTPWVEVPKLQSIRRDDSNKVVHVAWENGAEAKFAYVWLRDNCPAPHTYQLTDKCKARKMVMSDLDIDVQPRVVENRGDHVYVEWPEGKISIYGSKWLALRNLDDASLRARRREVLLNDNPETWGHAEIAKRMRWYDFERLLVDDRTLHDALMEIVRLGILFIDKAPAKVGQLRRLADRIGFEYMTHYGQIFTVKSGANPSNVAYTSGGLGLHTDLPYMRYAPQLQALHTIEQVRTKGGENQFADAFHVAEQIRRADPESYRILCEVPLEYVDDGKDYIQFDLTYKRPVFSFDENGRLSEVHFSNQQRSWFYDVPVEELYNVYKALKTFDTFMRSPTNMLELKLAPGQMVLFHNLRVLHGRSTFEMTPESGGRHMEGCYFNWDYVKSQIRILRDRLRIEPNQVSV